MRPTIRDVVKHPSWFGGWWADLPLRTKHFWKLLLFDKGTGWLRWGFDERTDFGGYMDAPEPYEVAPPLRRLWIYVRAWLMLPYVCTFGYKNHYEEEGRTRLTFTEWRLTWGDISYLVEKERKRELWH